MRGAPGPYGGFIMMLRLVALVMVALLAPLPLAACQMHTGGSGDPARVVLEPVIVSAGQTTPASASASSCCGSPGCECGAPETTACALQFPSADGPCLCGCADTAPRHVPIPAPGSARAGLSKMLARVELLPLLQFVLQVRTVPAPREPVLRTGTGQLFLLNLSLRT